MRALILNIILLSCASYKSNTKFSVEKDIAYGDHERHVGDYYKTAAANAPMVVIVHGGGWSGRSKEDMRLIAESLASNGIHVFNINYRLAPEFKHPAPIEDLAMAVDFVFKNYKFSGEKIGLWGYSAGAHITFLYGLQSSKVAALVGGGGPYDLSWYQGSPYIVPYIGYDLPGNVQKYLEASPVHYLHKDAPPMFMYHAEKDELVEHAQMRAFYAQARLQNIEASMHTIRFWGHTNTFIFASKPLELSVKFLKSKL